MKIIIRGTVDSYERDLATVIERGTVISRVEGMADLVHLPIIGRVHTKRAGQQVKRTFTVTGRMPGQRVPSDETVSTAADSSTTR